MRYFVFLTTGKTVLIDGANAYRWDYGRELYFYDAYDKVIAVFRSSEVCGLVKDRQKEE